MTIKSHQRFGVGVRVSQVILKAGEMVTVDAISLGDLMVAGMDRDVEHVVKVNEEGRLVWLSDTQNRLESVAKENANVVESDSFLNAVTPKDSPLKITVTETALENWSCHIVNREGVRLHFVQRCLGRDQVWMFSLWFCGQATPYEKDRCGEAIAEAELRKTEAELREAEDELQKAEDELRKVKVERLAVRKADAEMRKAEVERLRVKVVRLKDEARKKAERQRDEARKEAGLKMSKKFEPMPDH